MENSLYKQSEENGISEGKSFISSMIWSFQDNGLNGSERKCQLI